MKDFYRLLIFTLCLLLAACEDSSSNFVHGAENVEQGGTLVLESGLVMHNSLGGVSTRFSQGEDIELTLSVKNNTDEDGILSFNSGQQYDFYLEDISTFEVWRWSANQLFTQALTEVLVPAGNTITFSETWHQRLNNSSALPTGHYRMYGFVIGQPESFIDITIE